MSMGERAKAHVKGIFGYRAESGANVDQGSRSKRHLEVDDQDDENENMDAKRTTVQYRLAATQRVRKRSWIVRLLCCFGILGFGGHRGQGLNVNPNHQLAMYLHWMFRVNFVFLFGLMCVVFFALVVLFSGFITLAGTLEPECVRIGGGDFGHAGTPFADAVRIVWSGVMGLKCFSAINALKCPVPLLLCKVCSFLDDVRDCWLRECPPCAQSPELLSNELLFHQFYLLS
jgi:hypothetical protein